MTILQLHGIGKTFTLPTGEPLQILSGIDLTLNRGEHVAIVGRSGSGKSTLLNLLGLLDSPTSGEYLLHGESTDKLSSVARSRLRGRTFGFVFQQFNLLPGRTATENAALPLRYASGRDFWQRNAMAREALEQVGLGERLDAMPERLSGGEQQRVAIARALVRSPQIILADEPTGALDVETGATVMDLLHQVCLDRGATLVTITHDLAIAARADTRYLLDHGRLGPPADTSVATAPLAPVTTPSAAATAPIAAPPPPPGMTPVATDAPPELGAQAAPDDAEPEGSTSTTTTEPSGSHSDDLFDELPGRAER